METTLKLLGNSFSIVGTKALSFSDDPKRFIVFSDTGGVFGTQTAHTFTFIEFCSNSLCFVTKSRPGIRVKINFDGGGYLHFETARSSETQTFLNQIVDWSTKSYVPELFFPSTIEAGELARIKEEYGKASDSDLDHNELYLNKGFVPLALSVKDGRVQIKLINYPPTELPISDFLIQLSGDTLKCRNTLMIGDRQIRGFSLELPTEAFAAKYLRDLGLDQAASAERTPSDLIGLIGQVHVEGIINGGSIEKTSCDARIDEKLLTIVEKATGHKLCAFQLDSAHLAIDGVAQEFVISSEYSTILRITAESKPFLQAVFSNASVQESAKRSANCGPFIATNHESAFVRIEDEMGRITLSTAGGEPQEITDEVAPPMLCFDKKKTSLHLGDYSLQAEVPTLEGVASKLAGVNARAETTANFPEIISQILGLEGQYLTYCVFGRLAEAHLTIANALSVNEGTSFSLSTSKQDKETFLGMMGQFAGAWSREVETVIHYLAPFVVNRDRELLESAGLTNRLNYIRAEASYQQTTMSCAALASHLFRIEGTMSRFTSFRKDSAKGDGWMSYAPLGASIAGALTVNPLMAVGAFQQASALYNRETNKSAMTVETLNEVFDCCSQEWDFVIQTLVPILSNRFAQNIYPLRLALSHILIKAYETGDEETKKKLALSVAQRFGRLKTFLQFPSSSTGEITRGRCVDFLLKRQNHAHGVQARHF